MEHDEELDWYLEFLTGAAKVLDDEAYMVETEGLPFDVELGIDLEDSWEPNFVQVIRGDDSKNRRIRHASLHLWAEQFFKA